MSSVALGPEVVAQRGRRRAAAGLIAAHGTDIVLALPVALLAIVALAQLPREVNVDSWLELVTGRLVWQHGIPHHETLTTLSHGIPWIDQQWLAQLAAYAIYHLGGLGLLGTVNAALLCTGVGIATFATRRLGAPFRSALVVLPLCLALMMPSRELRTQAFAVPLFATLVYLLARDGRQPSRRVFWCLPLLVLWANVHGTVTMGAMLVALHGALLLFERRGSRLHSARDWRRPLALIGGAAGALLITPYGLASIDYYRTTMVNGTLRRAVSEWQPVTSVPITAALVFLLTGLAIWSFGRRPAATTRFEKLAVLVLAVSAISVVRNSLFLGLLAMVVVPLSLDWGAPEPAVSSGRSRALINGALGGLAAVVLVVSAVATLARPTASIEYSAQHPQLLAAVQRVTRANPGLLVMADEHFADWLLWRDPALAGRIANDVRFEILTGRQIQSLQSLFLDFGPTPTRVARGFRLLILDKTDDPGAWITAPRERGRQILFRDSQQMLILRSRSAAQL